MLINKFIPHKPFAKQVAFMMLPHMEALYGGQAGGGKSDCLLAIALQYVHIPGYSAIVFRRTLTDLKQPGALLDRAHAWLRGKPGCRFAGDEHTYYFDTTNPDGSPGHPAKVAFGYIGETNVQTRYQSAEYQCVEKGTKVLMVDGTYLPIELVKVGDRVVTLNGPKPVTQVFGPMQRDCVRIGTQVQGSTHKVLTPSGVWASCDSSVPIECCVVDKSYLSGSLKGQSSLASLYSPTYHQDHIFSPVQLRLLNQLSLVLSDTSKGVETSSLESCESRLSIQMLLKLFSRLKPFELALLLNSLCYPHLPLDDIYDDLSDSLSPSLMGRYLSYRGLYGGLPHETLNTYQVSSPSPVYAVAPNHSPSLSDAILRFQGCNHLSSFWYIHPYNSGSLRFSEVVPSVETFIPERVGERTVYDLTVEDENHFITESGIINRNCCIWDELTQHEESNYLYLFSRLRKKVCPTHKSDDKGTPIYNDNCPWCQMYKSLPLRVRAATNPGGVGHQWVKDRFKIEPDSHIPAYEIREDDTNINWVGRDPDKPFIQASYRDNPFIDQKSYAEALDNLPAIERARLKYGNWAVNVDARFKRRWIRHYSTRGDRYFVLGRDGVGKVIDFKEDIQRVFATVDPAASQREGMTEYASGAKEASWTVIAVWALTNDFHLLLLDRIRFQDEIPVVVQELVKCNKKWHPQYFRIEGNGLGKGVVQYSQIYGLTVKEGKRYTDKVVNSTAAQLRMEQGRIWFPQSAPWLKEWEDEIFNWTGDGSQTDDQVDVLADAAQDIVWEAGDDREGEKKDFIYTDFPGCFSDREVGYLRSSSRNFFR